MNSLVEYIASAVRFATEETGLRDWSGFIILVNEFEVDGKDEILGMPVHLLPMRVLNYTFAMAYPWDIDRTREKALLSIVEYQEIYPYTGNA
jgi:hypothetical protein